MSHIVELNVWLISPTAIPASTHPGRCRSRRCRGGGGSRGQRGPAVGGGGRGAGGRGVPGARLGASTPGAESGQALRTSFREDEFLPELQVGATTSWEKREGRALVPGESGSGGRRSPSARGGGRGGGAASKVRRPSSCSHRGPCRF